MRSPPSPPASSVDRPTDGDDDDHPQITDHLPHYQADVNSYSPDLSADEDEDHEMADVNVFNHQDNNFIMDAHDDDEDDDLNLDLDLPDPSAEGPLEFHQQPTTLPTFLLTPAVPPAFPILPPLPSTIDPMHVDVNPQTQFQLQQQAQMFNSNPEAANELGVFHPPAFSNSLVTLGPENPGLVNFLRVWARSARSRDAHRLPHMEQVMAQMRKSSVTRVEYGDLMGDKCDFQGIDWNNMGVTRNMARIRRLASYVNYVNKPGSDVWHPGLPDWEPASRENYFRFRSMDVRRDVRLLHFQLRNLLGCASRTRVFYPVAGAITELDPTTGRSKKAMDFQRDGDVQISTLAVNDHVLVAGGFNGDYRFRNVNSEDLTYIEGKLTDHQSGITNHVQIHPARRSSSPLAAFASNDNGFRVVDLATNKMITGTRYNYALNCSAISPDQRLRVMVGDHFNVLITDAETGEVVQDLSGHRDFGFACAWAPNGWTVATGFQDKSVRIWDARKWKSNSTGEGLPVAVVRMEMAGARSLRFSPLGSGKRLLVAAEEADVVNIIDAQTFSTKQKVEVFGEIGGTAFADEGQNLMTLVCDPTRGGVMRLDRCDHGAEDGFDHLDKQYQNSRHRQWWRTPGYDWEEDSDEILNRPDSLETFTHRRRKAAGMSIFQPF